MYSECIADQPEGIHNRKTKELALPKILELGRRMEQEGCGAQAIALACTGMGTIGIAPVLRKETGLPVVDPVLAEGLFAWFELVK